jgi:hypothetical protein
MKYSIPSLLFAALLALSSLPTGHSLPFCDADSIK